MKLKNEQPRGELDGFLDSGGRLTGELHFKDTFRVDGRINGKVVSEGDLFIGESGEIEGEVQVRRLFVAGKLRGTILQAQRVEIAATGKVLGDLRTETLVIDDGAIFEGQCSMERKGERAEVAKLVPDPSKSAASETK